MSTARTGEDGSRERRDFEEYEDVRDDEKQKEWKVLDHRDRIVRVNEVCVVRRDDVAEHAETSGGDYFVKGEAEIRLEPSPEQELQLVED